MSQQNKDLARRLFDEVVNQGNPDALDQFVSPNVVDHHAVSGRSPGIEGMKGEFRTFLGAFSNQQISVDDLIAEGDRVVARTTTKATHDGEYKGMPGTGREITFGGIDVLRVENGKVVERWGLVDEAGMMEQLGIH